MASGAHNNDRQRVLDATDIVRLVGDHLTLRAKGREYVCVCPFHDDHKPSMYVVPQKQIYHCFSCGAGGNALDFVINYHKMDFLEALKFLADRAGVELTPRERRGAAAPDVGAEEGEGDERAGRAELAQANRFAADFFRMILKHPEHGAAARAVVERRGISPEMVERFEIGAAPDRWDGLLKVAEVKRVPEQWLAEAGLLKTREQGGGRYDTFRNRLMFPIHDQLGRPIAFGGRKIDEEDEPKYLNSPETRLFDKGATLFGLHQAFRAIQNERVAIVTEGYTDVIACHQAGVCNVVATLGTALTPKHATVLKRVCDAVVLLFDADEAGARATDRAMEVFFAEPIDVRIATLPEGKDPDELFKLEGGLERFRAAVAGARDALEHRFARLRQRLTGASATERSRLAEEEVARLVELGLDRLAPIRRSAMVRRLASLAGVSEQSVLAAIEAASRRRRPAGPPGERGGEGATAAARAWAAAEHALGCLLCDPSLRFSLDMDWREIVGSEAYGVGPMGLVASAFASLAREADEGESDREPTLSAVLAMLDDQEARRLAASLAAETERVTDHDPERLRTHLAASLKSARLDRARLAASAPVGAAVVRGEGDSELLDRLNVVRTAHRSFGGDPRNLPRPAAT